MQITILKKTLADALNELAPLAGKNKALRILDNVKIVTKGNKIRLQTSDTETTIRKYVEAEEIDQDCEFLVECASVTSFVNKINSDQIKLILEDGTLTVKHPKGKASFQTLPTEDFHEVVKQDDGIEVTLPASDLARLIAKALNFVSHDDFKANLKPVRAIVECGILTICATDTHKLFTESFEVTGDVPNVAWNIEPSMFTLLVNACRFEEFVTISVSDRNVIYRVGASTFYSQQTQYKYVDFARVIPESHKIEVHCNKNELLDAVKRSSLFIDDTKLIRVNVSENEMNITVDNVAKLKSISEKMPCESNESVSFGANASMLAECVKACDSCELTLELNSSAHPIVIKDKANPNRTILFAPMSITPQV